MMLEEEVGFFICGGLDEVEGPEVLYGLVSIYEIPYGEFTDNERVGGYEIMLDELGDVRVSVAEIVTPYVCVYEDGFH